MGKIRGGLEGAITFCQHWALVSLLPVTWEKASLEKAGATRVELWVSRQPVWRY